MARKLSVLAALFVVVVSCHEVNDDPPRPRPDAVLAGNTASSDGQLWAGIAVSEPVIVSRDTARLHVTFAVINDGATALDPDVDSAELIINGEVFAGSDSLFGSGPRSSKFDSIPPGDYLLFGYDLAEVFRVPGTYTISWRGQRFRSNDVQLRVLSAPKTTDS